MSVVSTCCALPQTNRRIVPRPHQHIRPPHARQIDKNRCQIAEAHLGAATGAKRLVAHHLAHAFRHRRGQGWDAAIFGRSWNFSMNFRSIRSFQRQSAAGQA
ncbi:MAG: hypothetical protein R3D61_10995 [Defluviimonas denitrificans]